MKRSMEATLRITAIIFVATSIVSTTGTTAEAAGPNFTTAQHNITHQWYGALRFIAEHERPITMTANEVCYLPLLSLSAAVDDFGYGGRAGVSTSASSVCAYNGANLDLFNVAYTQGNVHSNGLTLNTSFEMPGTNSADRRQVPCAYGSAFGYHWYVCSAHLVPENYPLAAQQSDWLRYEMLSTPFGNGPRIVGGDFDLHPRQDYPYWTGSWKASWQESDDTCHTWNRDRRTTTGGAPSQYLCTSNGEALRGAKIDYLWASAFWFVDTFGVADIRCKVSPHSHHCALFSIFQWR